MDSKRKNTSPTPGFEHVTEYVGWVVGKRRGLLRTSLNRWAEHISSLIIQYFSLTLGCASQLLRGSEQLVILLCSGYSQFIPHTLFRVIPTYDGMHIEVSICFFPSNVSTWFVAWYPIVAKKILLIQFHAVWVGASIVAFFPDLFLVLFDYFLNCS